MISKKPAPDLIRGGNRFPACAKPWHCRVAWADASAGEGRSEKDHAQQRRSAMPPVILWVIGIVGAAIVSRVLYREAQRVNAVLHPEPPAAEPPPRALERDPKSGVYRPK